MNKILYIAFVDFNQNHHGVNKKIINQSKVLENEKNDVEIIARQDNFIVLLNAQGELIKVLKEVKKVNNYYLKNLIYKQQQYKEIKKILSEKKYKACYIRYDLSGMNFIKMLKDIKNDADKIVIEVPTYPYENEYSTSTGHKIKLNIDMYYRKKLKKYVDRIVTYYHEDYIFEVPTIKTINGFSFENTEPIKNTNLIKNEINIIAVASMRSWHGYERAIEGLKKFYEKNVDTAYKIKIHIVGEGPEIKKYKEMTLEFNLSENIIFHGNLHGEQLDRLFEECNLAIDSLARHRTNITVLSSLKSREYGSKGIPIINSCKIDILNKNYKYVLYVPEDESPLEFESIIDFYEVTYKEDKKEVIKNIRTFFEENSSMELSMKEVKMYINQGI